MIVLRNAAMVTSFRDEPEDAGIMVQEFQPKFEVEDLIDLPNCDINLKLVIDGTPSPPFSTKTTDIAAFGTVEISRVEIAIGHEKIDCAPLSGILYAQKYSESLVRRNSL